MSTKQIIMTAKEFAFDLLQTIDDGVREHTTAFVASGFVGAVAGLGVWCFVNSGLLASNPLIIFLAVHPIGWSIVAGSLVFAASYSLSRKLASRRKMVTHLNAYNKSDLYEKMEEIQCKHILIETIRQAETQELKVLLSHFIMSKHGTKKMKSVWNEHVDSHRNGQFLNDARANIIEVYEDQMKSKDPESPLKTLKTSLGDLVKTWTIFEHAYNKGFNCEKCAAMLITPNELCLCDNAIHKTHCNKEECCQKIVL